MQAIVDDKYCEGVEELIAIQDFRVGSDAEGLRLDHFLVQSMPERSRSQIQAWVDAGRVLLNGRPTKASARLKPGQELLVEIPPLEPAEPIPQRIPLDILYEDSSVLVLNKQRGLVIHPAIANPDGTLVNALLAHCNDLSGIRGVEMPGIVHRLDKNTSGVMVVAKSDRAHLGLTNQFRDRTVLKVYEAIVHGVPSPRRGTINQQIGRHTTDRTRMAVVPHGRVAVTDYEVAEEFADAYSRVELHIHTGRTHQIRVHMTWMNHPIVGDPLYGRRANPFGLVGQALHCKRLGFVHPVLGKAMEFTSEPPAEYLEVLNRLRSDYGSLGT